MKSWVILGLATCLGLAIGIGTTVAERLGSTDIFGPLDYSHVRAPRKVENKVDSSQPHPRIEFVNGQVYDFGSMDRSAKQTHTFVIKNVGNAPLKLEVRRTTCKCTISSVADDAIMPGETVDVEVDWTAKTLAIVPEFEQMVELGTNDPENELITLVIKGYVTDVVRMVPSRLVLGEVLSDTGTSTSFRIFGYRSKDMEILRHHFENVTARRLFSLEFSPLPEEEIAQEKGAQSGMLATMTIQPGLPLGPIRQSIRINLQSGEYSTLRVDIEGRAISDIMLASSPPYFSAGRSLVEFGAIKRNETVKSTIRMFVKGEHRYDTKFTVGEVDPAEYLHVEIGPPKELGNGRTVCYTVTIEIPAGLPPVNRLGSELAKRGSVVLETTHPVTKTVPIGVVFAVE